MGPKHPVKRLLGCVVIVYMIRMRLGGISFCCKNSFLAVLPAQGCKSLHVRLLIKQ